MGNRAFTLQDNPDQGILRVSVFLEGAGAPAEAAVVQVLSSQDNKTILAELYTDASGITEEAELPAPPLEYSLAQDQPQPYSTYDIIVMLSGYQSVRINEIQIFSSVIAYQDVVLMPSPQGDIAQRTLIVPEPVLWGSYPAKIVEEPVKPLPESDNFIVLPEPVIPEFIVVHNGVPTDTTAQNYWVPFRDYIKNVASSEIYSTWPTTTITANILAILSFTLNRVYTEWYRSQGYNFTITNTTSYDQAFSYGRTIYREISVVVDGLFTNFITKPDIKQPLLTQYCDGQNSQCPGWLTQWGSKELGDQGYDAVSILKHFYGSEIYLMEAESVEGVPTSFPGTPLQMGSSGQSVRMLQEQLNTIGGSYPAIGKIPVTGVYDDATRNAVTIFQGIFALPETGIVDSATWYKISYVYVAVTRMAEL